MTSEDVRSTSATTQLFSSVTGFGVTSAFWVQQHVYP